MSILGSRRRAVTALTSLLSVGALVGAGVSDATPTPGPAFDPAVPTVFIEGNASGSQLETAHYSGTQLSATVNVGTPYTNGYNAMAYDPQNGYLYAADATSNEIDQIAADGSVTDTGVALPDDGYYRAAWDPDDDDVYFGGDAQQLIAFHPATGASSLLTLSAADFFADFTYAGGYFWGLAVDTAYRIDPASGQITTFTVPTAALPNEDSGDFIGAWTDTNGDLSFLETGGGGAAKTSQIYELAVANPASTSPTFTAVTHQTIPGVFGGDAASGPADADLGLTQTASQTDQNAVFTLTVTNHGPGASPSDTVTDHLPSGLAHPATSTAGCAIASGTLTCTGGSLASAATATITVTGTPLSPTDSAITNSATVAGSSQVVDRVSANNTGSAKLNPPPPPPPPVQTTTTDATPAPTTTTDTTPPPSTTTDAAPAPVPEPTPAVVVPPAAPTGAARVTGTAEDGHTLSCVADGWTGAASYTYAWRLNGAPISGAGTDQYLIPIADRGATLSCAITGTGAGGSFTAASAGTVVAVPGTLRCPAATGSLTATQIGPLALGMSATQSRAKLHSYKSFGAGYDKYCLYAGWGIRVRYSDHRAVFMLTQSTHYAISGVRDGQSVAAMKRALGRHLAGPYVVGSNTWYADAARGHGYVFKTVHDTVEEIGITGWQNLTRGASATRTFFGRFRAL